MSVLLSFAVVPVERWRRLWHRATRSNCPICGDKLKGQVGSLLGMGFYPAAVVAARLRLELLVVAYFQRVKGVGAIPRDKRAKREKPSFSVVVMFLHHIGEIDGPQRNRLLNSYARTSQVIHGEPCPRHLAKQLVAEVDVAIEMLKGGAA